MVIVTVGQWKTSNDMSSILGIAIHIKIIFYSPVRRGLESQNVCHCRGSPLKVGKVSLESLL